MIDENIFVIALLKCKGIGKTRALEFIVQNNFNIESCIENINSIVSKDVFEIAYQEAKVEVLKNLSKNIKLITIFDSEYTSKLYTMKDPVLYLYYIGDIRLLNRKSVAIIGTRKPSDESVELAKKTTKIFTDKDYVIVSGLALGIDAVTHEECLNNKGKTIAILPSALDNIQPKSNTELARRIVKNGGCLVSEYSIGTEINKFNYAQRDRIQSALSNTIIVIEAEEKSGTMIATKKSISEGKPVFQLKENKIRNNIIKNNINIYDEKDIETVEEKIEEDFKMEYLRFNSLKNKVTLKIMKVSDSSDDEDQISLF